MERRLRIAGVVGSTWWGGDKMDREENHLPVQVTVIYTTRDGPLVCFCVLREMYKRRVVIQFAEEECFR